MAHTYFLICKQDKREMIGLGVSYVGASRTQDIYRVVDMVHVVPGPVFSHINVARDIKYSKKDFED